MPTSVSIITAVRNGAATIRDCLECVQAQTHRAEHIVVDGASNDGTLGIVNGYRPGIAKVLSEPDRGIYDAMNKGIGLATGDVVGLLNADDFYTDERVIAKVAAAFDTMPIEALFADLVYVRPDNLNKVVRHYSGANFSLAMFAIGWMPPHPTCFIRRECYLKYGLFKTDYRIAADFELLARFLVKHRVRYRYLPEVLVKMRTGGISTRNLMNNVLMNREVLRACRENDIGTNMLRIYSKYPGKVRQLCVWPQVAWRHGGCS